MAGRLGQPWLLAETAEGDTGTEAAAPDPTTAVGPAIAPGKPAA
jgi:hypothetical protein